MQLYPGKELPSSQVAQVSRSCSNDYPLVESKIDGTAFCMRTAAVLPGKHLLTTDWQFKSSPYDCYSRQEFDSYGYSSCRDNRESDINKGREPRDCYESSYWKTITNCLVDHILYTCDLEAQLAAGSKYEVRSQRGNHSEREAAVGLFRLGDPGPAIPFRCSLVRSWQEREDQ